MSDLFPTRRLVVLTGLALASTPVARLPGAHANQTRGLCLYDTRAPASRAFARGFGGQAVESDPDIIRTLRDALTTAPPDRVVGLVGWAHFLLARDALREHGYRIDQSFEHRTGAVGATHFVQSEGRRETIVLPVADWGRALGGMFAAQESPRRSQWIEAPTRPRSGVLLFGWTASLRRDLWPASGVC